MVVCFVPGRSSGPMGQLLGGRVARGLGRLSALLADAAAAAAAGVVGAAADMVRRAAGEA